MHDAEGALRDAERNLNKALGEYKQAASALEHEFRGLTLQGTMFQYEICAEICGVVRNSPSGFAQAVALKGLIHRLYEYNTALNSHILKRLLSLASTRGVAIDRKNLASERRKWRLELDRLASWSSLRNKATGHYDADLSVQIRLLEQVDMQEVMAVTQAFLSFNLVVLRALQSVGRGSDN